MTATLRRVAARPACLFALLFALSALARPYANVTHDARLYSVQVLNRVEDGAYDDDLFFRYGSQDRYSLFSPLAAPVVRVLGLETGFFVLYLATNALFIAALMRLVRRLVADRVTSTLALGYLVLAPLHYGGRHILEVHEPFVTARLPAVALVLLGLDQLLDRRAAAALGLMVLAALLHPLMAFGGLLTWAGLVLVCAAGWRAAVALVPTAGLIATGALLALPQAGNMLGAMDAEWRDAIRNASPFNFTSEWTFTDWLNVGVGLALTAAAARHEDRRHADFFRVVTLVGLFAVVGTALAAELPYAIPLQGQPYRALWIVKVLQVPLALATAARLVRSGRVVPSLVAAALVAFLAYGELPLEWLMPLFIVPLAGMYYSANVPTLGRRQAAVRCAVTSFWVGAVVWSLYKIVIIVAFLEQVAGLTEGVSIVRQVAYQVGVVPWFVACLALLVWLSRRGTSLRAVGAGALALALAVQLGWHALPRTEFARYTMGGDLPDILFARDLLARRTPQGGRRLTVYAPYGRVEYQWLELRTNCYFEWWQAGGFMFSRTMAIEGQRRARLAAPFELARFRQYRAWMDATTRRDVERFYDCDLDRGPPTVAELAQLCREPGVDYLILKHDFAGLAAATNGRVFVYDSRQVCAALERRDAVPALAAATRTGAPHTPDTDVP